MRPYPAPIRCRVLSILVGSLLVASAAEAQPQDADSVRNGVLVGAALGAIGGAAFAAGVDDRCGAQCNTQMNAPTYGMYAAVGAGAGAGIGWLDDRLIVRPGAKRRAVAAGSLALQRVAWQAGEPRSERRWRDPSWDGAVKGAAVGAGAMAGLLAVGYARCDAGCEAPAMGPMFAWGLGVGAGGGAGIGWVIDRLHRAEGPPPVAVALRADREVRAVHVRWQF
jgi:hypothetical protein